MKTSAAWKQKRAEVLARADGRCEHCSTRVDRLNIHHRYYEAGKKDWDYPVTSLEALCPKCHGKADEMRRDLARALGMMSWSQDEYVLAFIRARSAIAGNGEKEVQALDHAGICGVAAAAGVSIEDVRRASGEDSEGLVDVVRLCLDAWDEARR